MASYNEGRRNKKKGKLKEKKKHPYKSGGRFRSFKKTLKNFQQNLKEEKNKKNKKD